MILLSFLNVVLLVCHYTSVFKTTDISVLSELNNAVIRFV